MSRIEQLEKRVAELDREVAEVNKSVPRWISEQCSLVGAK